MPNPNATSLTRFAAPLVALAAGAAMITGLSTMPAHSASPPRNFPAPPAEGKPALGDQVAVLAGGCFWGLEGVFEHVKGVKSVVSGYAGGSRQDATYGAVSSERTGHAEAIRVVYDPARISYGSLLKIYFSVAHDPTQVNRQFPDTGTSYRSAIFPQTPAQRRTAAAYIAAIDKAHAFPRPVATKLESGAFYPAEAYHQDFMRRNPDNGYTNRYDKPKIAALKTAYPQFYR